MTQAIEQATWSNDLDAGRPVPAGAAVIEQVWGRYADGTMTESTDFTVSVASPSTVGEVWAELEAEVRRVYDAQGVETRHYFLERLVQEDDVTYFVYGT